MEEEGVFIFGGLNKNQINSNFYVLKTDKWPFYYREVRAEGQPPKPRYHHTMNYMPFIQKLAVFGGINDASVQNSYLNDLYLFSLNNLSWTQVILKGRAIT